jgi:hypothetical protein
MAIGPPLFKSDPMRGLNPKDLIPLPPLQIPMNPIMFPAPQQHPQQQQPMTYYEYDPYYANAEALALAQQLDMEQRARDQNQRQLELAMATSVFFPHPPNRGKRAQEFRLLHGHSSGHNFKMF